MYRDHLSGIPVGPSRDEVPMICPSRDEVPMIGPTRNEVPMIGTGIPAGMKCP